MGTITKTIYFIGEKYSETEFNQKIKCSKNQKFYLKHYDDMTIIIQDRIVAVVLCSFVF